MLHGLQRRDRASSGVAGTGAPERAVEQPGAPAGAHAAPAQAPPVDERHGQREAVADLTDDVLGGYPDVVELQLAGQPVTDHRGNVPSPAESGSVAIDQEHRQRARARSGLGDRDDLHEVGEVGVGDPGLLPGEDPVRAVPMGMGAHREHVGADAAFGVGERRRHLSCEQGCEVLRTSPVGDMLDGGAGSLGPRQRGQPEAEPAVPVDVLLDVLHLDPPESAPTQLGTDVRVQQAGPRRASLDLPAGLPHGRMHPAVGVQARPRGVPGVLRRQVRLHGGDLAVQERPEARGVVSDPVDGAGSRDGHRVSSVVRQSR